MINLLSLKLLKNKNPNSTYINIMNVYFSKRIGCGIICLLASTMVGGAATIIVPNTPTSNVAPNAGSSFAGLVNGTQLSALVATGSDTSAALLVTHVSGTVSSNYVTPSTAGGDYYNGGTIPVLTFTLGSAYDHLESIVIWNYAIATSGIPANNSLKSFNLEFFSDAAATVSLGSETGLTVLRSLGGSTTVDQVAQQIFFGSQYDGVQAIKMTLTDNYQGAAGGGGGDRVGLGEVRFSQVPEPSVAVLGGVGLLSLWRRRRCDA